MRTIQEIKESIALAYMRNERVAELYGFAPGDDFSVHFSKASPESILFYIFAASTWVLESLFDEHRRDVEARIEEILPHRPKWYRDKLLDFMVDKQLIPDTDRYDTAGMSDGDIAAARVVKHATADENDDASILTVKVAGEKGGERCKLDADIEEQIRAYLKEIKDAGVRISLVNENPDIFNCKLDIYYDPTIRPDTVKAACEKAIENYIANLPFNGEYTNMALVDALQVIEGVRIPELKEATGRPDASTTTLPINARSVPAAGYFKPGSIDLNMKPYA